MSLLDTVTGWKWKAAGIGAVVILAVASFFLLQAQMENRSLTKLNNQLDARINNPATGYVVQLAQANTNVATLKTAVERQNVTIRTNAATADRQMAALNVALAGAERRNVGLRADAARILATPPKGNTLEQRVLDIDKRVLETLE
jgi:hypothetical protein